ncbi:uncharacterized protein EV422DRAFT_508411 [Fimicolochytrium jonesii]|uniref:uncharacterized protein n=1 Tax=Fimicolochytrium jonesii TaxID=1396493 RepID=UPI0022FE8B48|nr:uncharacterized protein EV422DRAFT_508411 [Fimicolochytrium jonesii]KAI8818206.1 hypothetical protein EV422DRAFT_508411 [Fimicolochytrium jonesii]
MRFSFSAAVLAVAAMVVLPSALAAAVPETVTWNGLDFTLPRRDLTTRDSTCGVKEGIHCAVMVAATAGCFATVALGTFATAGAAFAAYLGCAAAGEGAVISCLPCLEKAWDKLVDLAHKHGKHLPWEDQGPAAVGAAFPAPSPEAVKACLLDLVDNEKYDTASATRFCNLH